MHFERKVKLRKQINKEKQNKREASQRSSFHSVFLIFGAVTILEFSICSKVIK